MKLKHFLAGAMLALTGASINAQNTDAEQFSWMLGKWQGKVDEGTYHESWKQKDANTFLGEGYYIEKKDTLMREIITLQKFGTFWCYVPVVNNNFPVLFTLISSDDSKWVFENKEHDFPQRVVYQFNKDGSMLAWIEGIENGNEKKEEYYLKKIK